jgi:integrase
VKALKTPGRYGDGRGLHLYVKDAEKRVWVLRYMVRGRSRDMGLGRFPEVSLADAREKAEAARKLLRAGTDPLDAREAEKAKLAADRDQTFRRAAEDLIAAKLSSWRSPKYRGQWSATLTTYAYPVIGDWPVRQVDTEAVLRILRPLWERAPDTASKLRGRIEAVLDSAKASGWREGENPARWKGHLAARLPPPRKVKPVEHRPSLPWQQVGSFMVALRAIDGIPARAVEFAILTAARAGEVRSMPWREVDMDAAVWTVPAGRMKAAKAHRVPLSPAALAILQAVRHIRLPGDQAAARCFRVERAGGTEPNERGGGRPGVTLARSHPELRHHPARVPIHLPRLGRRGNSLPARGGGSRPCTHHQG